MGASSKLERSCLQSRQQLARLRNNGDKIRFDEHALTELAKKQDCFKAIAWQQRAACWYREHKFKEAYECLQMSKSLLVLGTKKFETVLKTCSVTGKKNHIKVQKFSVKVTFYPSEFNIAGVAVIYGGFYGSRKSSASESQSRRLDSCYKTYNR